MQDKIIKGITNQQLKNELPSDKDGVYKILDVYINKDFYSLDFLPDDFDIYDILDIKNKDLFNKLILEVSAPLLHQKNMIIQKACDPQESLYHIIHDNNNQTMAFGARVLQSAINKLLINYTSDDVSKSVWRKYNLEQSLDIKPIHKTKKI